MYVGVSLNLGLQGLNWGHTPTLRNVHSATTDLLLKEAPDFDAWTYGCRNLVTLVEKSVAGSSSKRIRLAMSVSGARPRAARRREKAEHGVHDAPRFRGREPEQSPDREAEETGCHRESIPRRTILEDFHHEERHRPIRAALNEEEAISRAHPTLSIILDAIGITAISI